MMLPTINVKSTCAHLKALIHERGYSVSEIQKALGLQSTQAIYRWLRGETLPSVDNLIKLAYILNVPIEEILVLENAGEMVRHVACIIRWCGKIAENEVTLRKEFWRTLEKILFQ